MNPKQLMLKIRAAIYPLISLTFTLIILLIFIKTIYFFSANVNRAFYQESTIEIPLQFDGAGYELIKKRLNLKDAGAVRGPAPASPNVPKVQGSIKSDTVINSANP